MIWKYLLIQFIFVTVVLVGAYVDSAFALLASFVGMFALVLTSRKSRIIIEEVFKHPLSSSDIDTRDGKLHAERRTRA